MITTIMTMLRITTSINVTVIFVTSSQCQHLHHHHV